MTTWINNDPNYTEYPLSDFKGNPLVEALNPPPANYDESLTRLMLKPDFSEEERELPASMRALCPERLSNFMFPTKKHIHIYNRARNLVFDGYRHRNPMTVEGQLFLHEAGGYINDITSNVASPAKYPSKILMLTGLSGIGKTSLIRAIMRDLGKPVIVHSSYKGATLTETQILYLMRNVPDQSGVKPLCQSFGSYTDSLLQKTLYKKSFSNKALARYNYVSELSCIVATHHVGAVVIDEFQNISLAKSGGKKEVIALIVNLCGQLGVPIFLVGTYRSAEILRDDVSIASRLAEGGFYELERPTDPSDEDWLALLDIVWEYQWVSHHTEISDDIINTLYDCSQGITRIMLNLFIHAQIEAIEDGTEKISSDLIKRIYRERFRPLHGIIDALRSADTAILENYDDLFLKAFYNLSSSDPIQNRIKMMEAQAKALKEKEMGIFDGEGKKSPTKHISKKGRKAGTSANKLLEELQHSNNSMNAVFDHISGN